MTSETATNAVFKKITELKYRMIIVSPELLLEDPRFGALWKMKKVTDNFINFILDEVHVVGDRGPWTKHVQCSHRIYASRSAVFISRYANKPQQHCGAAGKESGLEVDPLMDVDTVELVDDGSPHRKRKAEPDHISVDSHSSDDNGKSGDEKPEPKAKSKAKAPSEAQARTPSKTALAKKARTSKEEESKPKMLGAAKTASAMPSKGKPGANPKIADDEYFAPQTGSNVYPSGVHQLEGPVSFRSFKLTAPAAGHSPDSPSPSRVIRSFTYDPDSFEPVLPEGLIHPDIHGPDLESLVKVPADRRFISWRNGSENMALQFQVPDVSTLVKAFSGQPAWNVFLLAIRLAEKYNLTNPSRATPFDYTWVTNHYNGKTTHALHDYADGVASTDPVVCISVGLCASASLTAAVFASPGKAKKSIQVMLMPFEAEWLFGFFCLTRGRKSLVVQVGVGKGIRWSLCDIALGLFLEKPENSSQNGNFISMNQKILQSMHCDSQRDLFESGSNILEMENVTALSFETRQSEVRLDANRSFKIGKRSLDANDKVPIFDLRENFSLNKLDKLTSFPEWETSESLRGCALLLGYTAGIYHPDGVAEREALNFNILWAGVLHK
ncbi:hypothetical protein C8J56DRAFT_1091504 [Mycena floridula]|nr:hypothetical protein C8J56DRAFT_1091504 [Mycena floridula]